MLSYQHAYHAGNHADVLKHFVLTFVLDSLNKKEKPYTFIDTHAGSGLYDLLDMRSLKTGEALSGIQFLFKEIGKNNYELPESFLRYLDFIKLYLNKILYPGSPEIEKQFLRSQDFLVLSELHPQEVENLKAVMNAASVINDKTDFPTIQINNKNGFDVLNAVTPPKTKRGAVLIDPSYEEISDYENVTKAIIQVNKKWSNGIIMLWYPLLAHRKAEIDLMLTSIIDAAKKVNQNTEIVNLQLCVNKPDAHKEVSLEEFEQDKKNPPRLYGSGMLVINSPWHLDEDGAKVVDFLTSFFEKKTL